MIRTHRPRGHAWNCASVFQQTLEFRHISLDECEPPEDEILGNDPRDDWTLAERRAKRQRVEKLADDFLNGNQLPIHSARLDPQRFRTALTLSFSRPKDARAIVEDAELQNESNANWEDVDDDREVLRALVLARRGSGGDSTTMVEDDFAVPDDGPVITEVQAQASCGPKRNLRSRTVFAGPSEEALRKAAELRNRRLRKSLVDIHHESQPQSCPRPVIQETQEVPTESSILDTASDCGPTPTPAWTSSRWIKSGAFQLRRKGVDEDCSKDELGASSMLTPCHCSRTHARPLGRVPSSSNKQSQPSLGIPPVSSTATHVTDSLTMRQSTAQGDQESVASSAFVPETSNPSQDAPAEGGITHERRQDGIISTNQEQLADDDSQAKLLQRQGLHVAPRKSWVAVNDAQPIHDQQIEGEAGHLDDSGQASASLNRKPSKGRTTKSTGDVRSGELRRASSRRQSAPTESQGQANATEKPSSDRAVTDMHPRNDYTEVAVNGASPFVFRKRVSKSNTVETPETEHTSVPQRPPTKTPRRRVMFPSSDSPQKLAPAPHTPLADEHLNRILPRDSVSGRRSSATRKSLREELRASGAEISRCADDPSSSQGDASAGESNQNAFDGKVNETKEPPAQPESISQAQIESQPAWPGTQDQLAQAYKNLFTSPDKTDTALYLGEKSTPSAAVDTSKYGRQPLRQLSQEPIPLPSTQALLNDWQGWSTIKKPRSAGQRPSLIQSPTVSKGEMMINSDPAQSFNAADRRRSSLRFSMSARGSPEKAPSKDINSVPTPKLDPPQLQKDSSGFVKPGPRRSSGPTTFSLSFGFSTLDLPITTPQSKEAGTLSNTLDDLSFGQTMSSAAQPQRQLEPDYDSQELDFTITQIADDVLTTGVEGVMGGGNTSTTCSF